MGILACLTFQEQGLSAKAQELASFLQIPVNPENPQSFTFHLELTFAGLRLLDSQERALEIDFLKDHLNYQRRGLRGKNELLAKALGYSKGVRKVLDLSAGLGIDAVFMTQLGFQVTSVERSRLLFVLLDEALKRSEELQPKLQFICADSFEYLQSQTSSRDIEAIYFDPMYPHKKKTALPKQEMVVFRELVGNDEDASRVLEEALKWPVSRVVVKRPLGAEELLPGVRHSFEGKVVRYDVYMRSL
ncbi:class I SAM-dependent methyltransferase [Bdellovibrio sp. HCB337]|uniref:class I SAM-dependent methyltransferase n=1 Tax=Bdellovibrio sp. HCB337 TaxID=3394358 RepID=UPI0039A6742C